MAVRQHSLHGNRYDQDETRLGKRQNLMNLTTLKYARWKTMVVLNIAVRPPANFTAALGHLSRGR